jgi:hypothetical protein
MKNPGHTYGGFVPSISEWGMTFILKRYLCYTLYIVKAKENSKEFVWQIIMVDGKWCSERG